MEVGANQEFEHHLSAMSRGDGGLKEVRHGRAAGPPVPVRQAGKDCQPTPGEVSRAVSQSS